MTFDQEENMLFSKNIFISEARYDGAARPVAFIKPKS